MKKRTKIIVLAAMIVLLGVTGYFNLTLNNRITEASGQVSNYFSDHIASREETREKALLLYESTINNANLTAEERQQALADKNAVIALMQAELNMEHLIKTQSGFTDVLVTYSNSYINVLVKGQLERQHVSQIVNIVKEQTGTDPDYITVTPM